MRETGESAAESPDSKPQRWCWYSTVESADARVVSVLAIVETILAIGVFLWIFDNLTTTHLFINGCIGLFLLLRTPRSTNRGISATKALDVHFGGMLDYVHRRFSYLPEGFLSTRTLIWVAILVSSAFLTIFAIAFRVVATATTVVSHPLESLGSIPANWWRIAACVDSVHPPEVIPGLDRYMRESGESVALGDAWTFRRFFHTSEPRVLLVLAPLGTVIFLPALVYRWSLKGNALIYLPFVWIARGALKGDILSRLDDIRNGVQSYIGRVIGAFVIVFVLSKILLSAMWGGVSSWLDSLPGGEVLSAYLTPLEVPRWQVSSFINSCIAWGLLILADNALRAHKRTGTLPSKGFDNMLKVLALLRGLLGIYSIMLMIYVAASLVEEWGFPKIGSDFLPEGFWAWVRSLFS